MALISAPGHRDPEVHEMIRHFDEIADKHQNWSRMTSEERFSLLRKAEREAILEQVELCMDDFAYAAKNYFWITNKRGEDTLFTLWESQFLVLQKYYELKSRGVAQKIMVLKARQLGALDPSTKVLTADLRWVEIDSLRVGDEVVSVDEFSPGGKGRTRKLLAGTVLNKWSVKKEAFRITFTNGKQIIATGDHPFLCQQRGSLRPAWITVKQQPGRWRTPGPMKAGDLVRFLADPWDQDPDFEDGWFSGMMDGEGSYHGRDRSGMAVSVSQVEGDVLKRAAAYLAARGYSFHTSGDIRKKGDGGKFGNRPVHRLTVGRIPEVLKLVGRLRPTRFISKRLWEGKELPGGASDGWLTVATVESVGEREMVDIETTAKTFIAEGLVTHNCSLLIEALIAWRTMFFPNTKALIVSVVKENSADLFGLLLHIYDHMPWWLKPQLASREEKDGLWFNNPDPEMRSLRPGLDSKIYVQFSTQVAGVGQGKTLRAVHVSEYADFLQRNFRALMEGDLLPAIADNPEAFAFLESTGRGAGTYSHDLWKSCEKMGERSDWYPLFLPWFFESTRIMAPPGGWRPMKPEAALRERIKAEWVRCNQCNQYMPAAFGGESRAGTICTACNRGTLESYLLTDAQAYWKETKRLNAESKDAESLKQHTAEYATTAEEAWQLSGYCVFDETCLTKANATVRNPHTCPDVRCGFLDSHGRFHSMRGKRCIEKGCQADHRFDDESFFVWEMPLPDHAYSIGVDVSEGIGQDYSVIAVTKIGRGFAPDEQVAIWRSNRIDPIELAAYANFIGRMYNEGMMAVEYNTGFRATADTLRFQHEYPNFFEWKHLDAKNPRTNRLHWMTMTNTKPKLWQTLRKWIKAERYLVRSPNTLSEMKTFRRDDENDARDGSAGHEAGAKDDELMATMISLYCAHEGEADERGQIPIRVQEESTEPIRYRMACLSCGFGKEQGKDGKWPWGASRPEEDSRCPKCYSIRIHGVLLEDQDARVLNYADTMDLLAKKTVSASPGPMGWGRQMGARTPGDSSLDVL